jgi:hypothetical protein
VAAARRRYPVNMRRLVLALCLAAAPALARAQAAPPADDDDAASDAREQKPAPPDKDKEPKGAPTESGGISVTDKGLGDAPYKGVVPGGSHLPPHPPRLPLKKGPQRMTWSGFQVRDGVPTVFIEVTALGEYRVEDAPGEITVTLKNTVVPLRNNRRALDVGAFDTGVKQVDCAARGKDLRVTIKIKGTERPQHHERVEDAAGGFRMLVIELPSAK